VIITIHAEIRFYINGIVHSKQLHLECLGCQKAFVKINILQNKLRNLKFMLPTTIKDRILFIHVLFTFEIKQVI
jgi:hypothetical protein